MVQGGVSYYFIFINELGLLSRRVSVQGKKTDNELKQNMGKSDIVASLFTIGVAGKLNLGGGIFC